MASIADEVEQIYNIDDYEVNLVSLIYFILFTPSVIIAMMIYNKHSLKTGIIVGAIFQTLGAIIKCFVNHSFMILIVGQGF